jgi:hypothetical protein
MGRVKSGALIGSIGLAFLVGGSGELWAGKQIDIKSINKYPGGGSLFNCIANGDGFSSRITQRDFAGVFRDVDGSAIDACFADPEVGNRFQDFDDACFDARETAISFFSGHGTCDGFNPITTCTSSADCHPPRTAEDGRCSFDPLRPTGFCFHPAPRNIVTNGDRVTHGNFVDYTSGIVKYGESANSGGWAGAGTNGGTNLVVLSLSCGAFRTDLLHDLGAMLAGVHMVATVMPVNGDTADVPNRGSAFADQFLANPNGSVAAAWRKVIHIISHDGSCRAGGGDGGGGGVNGCGANLVFAGDTTAANADGRMNENWTSIRDDALDAKGFSFWRATYDCNYDCNKFPIVKDSP